MASFSGLGIGLSLVFGCLLLALVAELYYLLWWKKRVTNGEVIEDGSNYYAKDFFHLICWKKPISLQTNNSSTSQDRLRDHHHHPQEANNCQEEEEQLQDLELGTSKDLLIKAAAFNNDQESVEAELMRLHNLAGPPRFLFTIKEETKEDLESDDGKSRGDNRSRKGSRTRSLSDIILAVDTPFLTPLASPHLKASALDSYHHHGFNNPLFESSSSIEAEINRLGSSPPPKFKFLRDAEEKLFRKLIEEAGKRASKNCNSVQDSDANKAPNSTTTTATTITIEEATEGSFLGFIVGKNKERDNNLFRHLPQYPSSSSQVLPLASSPTTFRPLDKNLNVH